MVKFVRRYAYLNVVKFVRYPYLNMVKFVRYVQP